MSGHISEKRIYFFIMAIFLLLASCGTDANKADTGTGAGEGAAHANGLAGSHVSPSEETKVSGVTEPFDENIYRDESTGTSTGQYAADANSAETQAVIPESELTDIAAHPSDGPMTIMWDYFYLSQEKNTKNAEDLLHPRDGHIAKILNERYGVVMDTHETLVWGVTGTSSRDDDSFVITGGVPKEQLDDLEAGTLSDIFSDWWLEPDNPIMPMSNFIESGQLRTIPWEMIEMYAPKYANFIRDDPKLRGAYSGPDFGIGEDETYTLLGLERETDILNTYSVYRLDWLEKLGIQPNGEMYEVTDRVFFTDKAFKFDEFVNIMKNFSKPDIELFGFATYKNFSTFKFDTLMGMWGLNWTNVNREGKAVLSAATDDYRTFLEFIEEMADERYLFTSSMSASDVYNYAVGWWNMHMDGLLSWVFSAFKEFHESIKILITPPEIGPFGLQGADSPAAGDDITIKNHYMISVNVSDAKLAKILQIFDDVSFDEELYVLTKYGIEGEDFTWKGAPYNSYVQVMEQGPGDNYTGVFVTNTIDGYAGKKIYGFPLDALADFAYSFEARSMNIKPYKSDPEKLFAAEEAALLIKYDGVSPYTLMEEYFYEVALSDTLKTWRDDMRRDGFVTDRRKRVTDTWDDYIAGLMACGLEEYTELINKYPITNY